MIKILLLLVSFLCTQSFFGQNLNDKYLHFVEYCYWDTMLYKATKTFYYEIRDEKMIRNEYPVLNDQYSTVSNDSPLVVNKVFEKRNLSGYPYRYILENKNIYLQYTEVKTGKEARKKEYSLDTRDTVFGLANKGTLDSESGLSVGDYAFYRGADSVKINSKEFSVYRFLEEYIDKLHHKYYTKEVFLDQKTLIPVKFVINYYDYFTRQKTLFSKVVVLSATTNRLAGYENVKAEELVLYEDQNLAWSKAQQEDFLNRFPPGKRKNAECIMNKLNGHVNFFQFDQTSIYKKLLIDCLKD